MNEEYLLEPTKRGCKYEDCMKTAAKDKEAFAKAAQEHDAAMEKYKEYENTTMNTTEYQKKEKVCMSSYVLAQLASDQFLLTTGNASIGLPKNGSGPERCQRH